VSTHMGYPRWIKSSGLAWGRWPYWIHDDPPKGRCRVGLLRESARASGDASVPGIDGMHHRSRVPSGRSMRHCADSRTGTPGLGPAGSRLRSTSGGVACAPGRALRNGVVGCSVDCCCPGPREALEVALHCLPRQSARELRRLLAPLDARVEDRTVRDPPAPAGQEWSRRGLLTASSRMGIDRSVSLCLVPRARGA
jgi:hypothetical protein